jgi:integrase
MQHKPTQGNEEAGHAAPIGAHVAATSDSSGRGYRKVLDGRKHPIRGLWIRSGRFYAQLTFPNPSTGAKEVRRIALLDPDTKRPVRSAAEAVKALQRLKVKREDPSTLPVLGRTPKFSEFAATYIAGLRAVGALRPATIGKTKAILDLWVDHFGENMRLAGITKSHILRFIEKRAGANISPRTCNLDVIALRGCLKRAMAEDLIRDIPMRGLRPLKTVQRKRGLFTLADIEAVCDAAEGATKNAIEFADYIRLMAFAGTRRNETLALRWAEVDFERGQLTVGAEGTSKNREPRVVDFNPALEAHLKAMLARRAPDSQWLFPSPQRGDRDIPAKTFVESLRAARLAASKGDARLARFGFHDCRHHFISMGVMSGVDFMTIAKWVGHQDGGVLIGKVYGHLADEHRKAMAAKMTFAPTIVQKMEVAQ